MRGGKEMKARSRLSKNRDREAMPFSDRRSRICSSGVRLNGEPAGSAAKQIFSKHIGASRLVTGK
jgi:hypothetical protein